MATVLAPEADVKMFLVLIAATLGGVVPGSAMAQQPAASGDVTVAYSYLSSPSDSVSLPAGWLVSASRRLTGPLFVVGEVGGNYRVEDGDALQFYTYQAGVRAAWSAPGQVPAYAQVLVGGATAACCGDSATRLMIEPGFGVHVPVGDRTAIRAGIGFPLALGDDGPPALVRAHVGVGFTFPAFGNRGRASSSQK
jgi:hypothetical protein